MDKQTIIEGNRLIAKFMGGEGENRILFRVSDDNPFIVVEKYWQRGVITVCTKKGKYVSPNMGGWTDVEVLVFHESWDWLMPVVDKINEIEGSEFGVTITGYKTTIESCYGTYDLCIEKSHGTTIENTYEAIVEFIKWYNKI